MRKQIYEQELQKEQEAKQRVKNDLMEALVRRVFSLDDIDHLFVYSFIPREMWIKYLKKVLKIWRKNGRKKCSQLCRIWLNKNEIFSLNLILFFSIDQR